MHAIGERTEPAPASPAAPPRRASTAVARTRALAGAIGNRAFASIARQRTDPISSGVSAFGHALTLAERFGDDVNARLVYDDETRRWNENEGRDRGDWGGALYDAWGYCYIAASHQRENPGGSTAALGTAYDIFATAMHEVWAATGGWIAPSGDRDTTTQDEFNRRVGIAIAREHATGDLYELCFTAMVEGRLDLTAAGVARGRALTTR